MDNRDPKQLARRNVVLFVVHIVLVVLLVAAFVYSVKSQ
jgi:hypothetical protein